MLTAPPPDEFCESSAGGAAPVTRVESWKKSRPLSGNSTIFLLSMTVPTPVETA